MTATIQFRGEPEAFIQCYVTDDALISYLWRGLSTPPRHGDTQFIHAPSHFDDLGFAPKDANGAGETAFYTTLNEAYKQFNVQWVLFINWKADG